ncbi:hypothetical protein, partial [uncultured Croceitalea sp.]|uniref:hypothetical protein n=2 Tax=uncultured Croceitalea sp. TaxID=1798908 RepID=UPI003305E458
AIAGTGIARSAAGVLSVDGTGITGDGDITSSDLTVGGDADALLGDVTLEIAAGAVGTTELADGAVTSAKIADDAVTLSKIENGTSSGQVIQWNGTAWTLVDLGSVTVTENDGVIGNEVTGATNGTLTLSGGATTLDPLTLAVSANGITSNELADDAVTPLKVDASIAGAGIARSAAGVLSVDVTGITGDGDITSSDLTVGGDADALLGDVTLEIAAGAVGTTELADDAVTSAKILDGTIASGDIADDAVTPLKIDAAIAGTGLTRSAAGVLSVDGTGITGDGDITSSDLTVGGDADALLGDVTLEIAAGAVGTTELADDAVTSAKILDGTIASGDIADDAVTPLKIDAAIAGTGIARSAAGVLSVDGTGITGDGDITSSDLTVGGDADALLGDVTLEIAA